MEETDGKQKKISIYVFVRETVVENRADFVDKSSRHDKRKTKYKKEIGGVKDDQSKECRNQGSNTYLTLKRETNRITNKCRTVQTKIKCRGSCTCLSRIRFKYDSQHAHFSKFCNDMPLKFIDLEKNEWLYVGICGNIITR